MFDIFDLFEPLWLILWTLKFRQLFWVVFLNISMLQCSWDYKTVSFRSTNLMLSSKKSQKEVVKCVLLWEVLHLKNFQIRRLTFFTYEFTHTFIADGSLDVALVLTEAVIRGLLWTFQCPHLWTLFHFNILNFLSFPFFLFSLFLRVCVDIVQGSPARLIATYVDSPLTWVILTSPQHSSSLHSIHDLRGKTIGLHIFLFSVHHSSLYISFS